MTKIATCRCICESQMFKISILCKIMSSHNGFCSWIPCCTCACSHFVIPLSSSVEQKPLQTSSEKHQSLLGEPVQVANTTSKTDDDLEEGEIPPRDELIINGEAGNGLNTCVTCFQ